MGMRRPIESASCSTIDAHASSVQEQHQSQYNAMHKKDEQQEEEKGESASNSQWIIE
jgi:hypothetical protein